MAKEFKDFDKQFSGFKGKAFNLIAEITGLTVEQIRELMALGPFNSWPHKDKFTEDYSADQIRCAVYESITALYWQRFRVSLKGLPTSEKLWCLSWYWNYIAWTNTEFTHIRVNNYLGALKRGGFLDKDLNIIK